MRLARWLVLGMSTLGLGCGSIATYTSFNLLVQPIQRLDDHIISARNCQLAEAAWDEFANTHAGEPRSVDYGRGFRDGFADYLDAGGSGEPPPVPPWRYRLYKYQTPRGHQAIEDWNAGFREGAAQAQASGYRRFVIIPPSLVVVGAGSPGHADGANVTPMNPATPEPAPLPMPRSLPPAAPAPAGPGEGVPQNP